MGLLVVLCAKKQALKRTRRSTFCAIVDIFNDSITSLTGGSLAGSTGLKVDSNTGQKLS